MGSEMNTMGLNIIFQENEETEQRFDFASGLTINKKYDKAGTAAITMPDIYSVRDIGAYSTCQIYLDGFNLFDGKTQEKSYSKDKITFKANDWLWDFSRKKRSFFQNVDASPDELFINAFDQNEIFDSFVGSFEEYTTPWINGFDAKSYVVAAETAPFIDFFDAENITGDKFMKDLAMPCFRGNSYQYHFWYELINGVKCLLFQPEGWGKVWNSLNYTISTFKETLKDLYNNIVVWGNHKSGFIPPSRDEWTEKSLDGWYSTGVPVALEFADDYVKVGLWSMKFEVGTNVVLGLTHSLTTEKHGVAVGSNLEKFKRFHMWAYLEDSANFDSIGVYLYDGENDAAFKTFSSLSTGWNEVEVIGKTFGGVDDWGAVSGSFDWDDVRKIYLRQDTSASGNSVAHYDNLFIESTPMRSDNADSDSGYDSISEDDYGHRTADVVYYPAKKVSNCNVMASNLVKYLKDPRHQAAVQMPSFVPLNLNDKIEGNFYGQELTLPINSVVWKMSDNGDISTKANLGLKRLELAKVLGKHSDMIDIETYDRGMTYYVY